MSAEVDSSIVPMDTKKICTELCQTTDAKSDATDAKSDATDAKSNTTNGKIETTGNRGLECYVLDEYVIPQQEKGEGSEQKEQKRGQNKHRPIFKQNNKARLQ
jgi:hypothetical protein